MTSRLRPALITVAIAIVGACVRPWPDSPDAGTAPTSVQAAPSAPKASAKSKARRLELFFTGADDGYLDACGCDDGQLGGLPRRHTLLRYLGVDDDHALVLSNGALIQGCGGLDRNKFEVQLQAMQEMRYCAVALTARELALGRAELAAMAGLLGDPSAFVATNIVDVRDESTAAGTPPVEALAAVRSIVRPLEGRRVAILAAVDAAEGQAALAVDPHVRVDEPVGALRAELARLAASAGADGAPLGPIVVLAQMDEAEATALAKALPVLDVIIIPGAEDEPKDVAVVVGTTSIVTTGRRGKFLGRFEIGDGRELGSYSREAIKDDLDKSETVKGLLETYRDLLKEDRILDGYLAKKPDPNGVAYVGADEATCAACHPKAWATWKASRHARAWQTLVEQDLPPQPGDKKGRLRNAVLDPDCVRCHVTGFGAKSGFRGLDQEQADAPLVNVSCEACHGPAGDHAQRAERGDATYPGGAAPRIGDGRAQALCVRCHDPDNSTTFELRPYWEGRVRGEQRAPVLHGKD